MDVVDARSKEMSGCHYSTSNKEKRNDVHYKMDEAVSDFTPYKVIPYHKPSNIDSNISNNHGLNAMRVDNAHD